MSTTAVIACTFYCDTCFSADFALTCVCRGGRCFLNVAYLEFFMCSITRDIVWPFACFSIRELSYLTENRYMEADSLPVEPACFFPLSFKLYLSLFKKDKEPPFRKHLCIRGALSLKIGSHHIKLFTFFSSAIQLIEGLN